MKNETTNQRKPNNPKKTQQESKRSRLLFDVDSLVDDDMSYKDKPSTERGYCTDDVNIDETNTTQHKSLTKLDLNKCLDKQTICNKGSTESKLPKTFLNIDTLVDPNVYQKNSCPKPNKSNDQVEIQSKLGKKEDTKKAKPVLDLDLLVDENVNYNKASVAKSRYDDDVNIKETTESQTKSAEIGYKKNKKAVRDILDVDDLINEDIGYENLNKSKVKTCLVDLFLEEESPVKLNTTKRVQFIGEEESDIEISQHNTPVLKNKAVTKPASRNLSRNKYDVDDILVGEVDVLKESSKTKSPNSAKKRIDVDTLLNEEKLDTERNTEAKKNIEVLTLSASSLSLDENDMSGSEAKNGNNENEDLTIDHVKFDGKKASRSLINMIDLDSECGEGSHKANKSVLYSGNKIGGTEWLKEVSKLNETSINHNESLVNDPSSLITSNPYCDSADGKKRKSKYIK